MDKDIPVLQPSDFRPVPKTAWEMFKERLRRIFNVKRTIKDAPKIAR